MTVNGPSVSTYLADLSWRTGDISPIINQALADYQAVELPAGTLPGYLGSTLVAKKNGQKLLGRSTTVNVTFGAGGYVHPDHLVSSYSEISRLRFLCSGGAPGITINRVVEKMLIAEVHVVGADNGFSLGPTDDSMLDHCTAERCSNHGYHILPLGPVPMALQWSSRDCRALLNGGCGMRISAFPIAGHAGGLACGTHQGFTTWANEQHGVFCTGQLGYPLHEPRFVGGFLGDDRWNLMAFDTYGDIRVTGTRLELPRERHGVYVSPTVHHAWLKGLTITGSRNPGSYGLYSDTHSYLHLSDSEIYNFGASGVYSNAQYGWICGLQSADNANYGLYLEHPNFRVYALSCYGNGMGDFGGPTPGVFI